MPVPNTTLGPTARQEKIRRTSIADLVAEPFAHQGAQLICRLRHGRSSTFRQVTNELAHVDWLNAAFLRKIVSHFLVVAAFDLVERLVDLGAKFFRRAAAIARKNIEVEQ